MTDRFHELRIFLQWHALRRRIADFFLNNKTYAELILAEFPTEN